MTKDVNVNVNVNDDDQEDCSIHEKSELLLGFGLQDSTATTAAIATKTPSSSLKEIRPLWDHRGGILARAFYMVSNYVLAYRCVFLLTYLSKSQHTNV